MQCMWAAGLCFLLSGLLLAVPVSVAAQSAERGWNDARSLELVRLAQERRADQQVDPEFLNYAADARGYVYFLLDHRESGRQELVRTDQVAVEVYWQAPDQVRQRIVGLRQREELPVRRLHYYLDRLTIVQDNYGDGIVIADGDNVNDVPHPAGPGALDIYDYRLTDSLTLRLPGAPEPVRVYELRVRPKDPSQPAVVGSIFVDAASGALVRMNFTFTRAAYIDRRLDYINVALESGLWQGRFWLPHEQRLEIRREMPELDFPVGTVIRTRMQVGNYRFNEPLSAMLFMGPPVTAAPPAQREAFAFEQPIDAEFRAEGITRPRDVAELRREARELLRQQPLSGLPRARLQLGAASDLFRYNRAEGAVVGLGAAFAPGADLRARLHGGWAFGAAQPLGSVELSTFRAGNRLAVSAYGNQPRDVGLDPGAPGVLNTFSALLAGRDYTDPFYASGGAFELQRPLAPGWLARGGVRAERHAAAELTTDFALPGDDWFRPVREVDPGTWLGGELALLRLAPAVAERAWELDLRADGGYLSTADGGFSFVRPQVGGRLEWTRRARDARLEVEGSAGAALGELPRQGLFLLGGQGTLPGYAFRAFGGDRFALGRGVASVDLARPWLRGRAFVGAGWTGVGGANAGTLESWGAEPTLGVRTSAGVGVGLFYDLLRLDVARGLGSGGRWEVTVEAARAFRELL